MLNPCSVSESTGTWITSPGLSTTRATSSGGWVPTDWHRFLPTFTKYVKPLINMNHPNWKHNNRVSIPG